MTSFRRTWALTVGTLRLPAPMRIAFEIERSLRPQPATATVRVYNLTRDHQAQIERAALGQVVVEAGYEGDRGAEVLFRGELFHARGRGRQSGIRTELDGTDTVTHVEARDGGAAYQTARISQSFEPGVSVSTVVTALVDALGVGRGNALAMIAGAELERGGTTYPEGTVLSGPVGRELTRILAGLGLRWSVQHGAVQITRRGEALRLPAVRLAPETGLIGQPDVGARGRVSVVSLLNSDLWPGRRVVLDSRKVQGAFTVASAKFRGDSHAQDWIAECELTPEAA